MARSERHAKCPRARASRAVSGASPECGGFCGLWQSGQTSRQALAEGARTPTAFHPSAQGCEERATLGIGLKICANPEGVEPADETLSGFVPLIAMTQGSARRATLG
jgi:hypothetical protein